MARSIINNPFFKQALQWISDTASSAWGDITGKPSWVAGTEEAFTTALKNKIDGIVDPLIYKGVINCSTNPNYPAASVGHVYKVSVAGKIGGASGANVEAGDALICATNTVAGDQATVGTNWNIVQANVDGAVIGPASAIDSNLVEFSGITGKIIKDSTLTHATISAKLNNIVEDTTPELGGEMDAGSHSIGFTEQAITSTAGTATINWKNSNKAKLTLSENVTTSTWTAPTKPCNLLLKVIQDATPRTIAWPAAVKWSGGTTPTLTATAGRIDIFAFYWDGTNFFGSGTQNFNIA